MMLKGWLVESLLVTWCLALAHWVESASPKTTDEDDEDNVLKEFVSTVNVQTCPPSIWPDDGERNFSRSVAKYLNRYCASRNPDDGRACLPMDPFYNYSMFVASEDVVLLGDYPKRKYIYWEVKFVVFWRRCMYAACSGDEKPFVDKNVIASVFRAFSANIGAECGFIVINYDIGEPLDDSLRLINILVLPCGLAVIGVMTGVVWFAVYLDKRALRKREEMRQEILTRKRDITKKRLEISRREKRNISNDKTTSDKKDDDNEFHLKPSPVTSPNVWWRSRRPTLPIMDDDLGVDRRDLSPRPGSGARDGDQQALPNTVQTPTAGRKEQQRHLAEVKDGGHHWGHKKRNAVAIAGKGQQKRHAAGWENKNPKKANVWRGGNILLRPLGKRAADPITLPNQYL